MSVASIRVCCSSAVQVLFSTMMAEEKGWPDMTKGHVFARAPSGSTDPVAFIYFDNLNINCLAHRRRGGGGGNGNSYTNITNKAYTNWADKLSMLHN